MATQIGRSKVPRPSIVRGGAIIHQKWVFAGILLFSTLILNRAGHFFDTIYRGWDTQYYYALARSIVHDHDLDITNDLELSPETETFDADGDGVLEAPPRLPNGRIASKYPIGLSILETPLVAVAATVRRVATAVGRPQSGAPGYSTLELWIVALGLLALYSYGLSELFAFLAQEFDVRIALVGLIGAWAGTSLFYYSAVFPFMAHGCAFALLTLTLRASDPARVAKTNHRLAALGILLAMLFLVRPQQVLIGLFLLPMVWEWCRQREAKEWLPGALVALVAIGAALGLEELANYSQYGAYSVSAYMAEDAPFALLRPRFDIVLLSGSRGLLVFAPLVVLAAAGFAACRKFVPGNAWAHALNFAAQIYVIAAWSSPDQGDSFGIRMLADNTAAVAIGLGVLLYGAGRRRWLVEAAAVGCCLWTAYLMARYMGVAGIA